MRIDCKQCGTVSQVSGGEGILIRDWHPGIEIVTGTWTCGKCGHSQPLTEKDQIKMSREGIANTERIVPEHGTEFAPEAPTTTTEGGEVKIPVEVTLNETEPTVEMQTDEPVVTPEPTVEPEIVLNDVKPKRTTKR